MVSGKMRERRDEPTVEGDVYMITEPRMKNKIIILFIIIIIIIVHFYKTTRSETRDIY